MDNRFRNHPSLILEQIGAFWGAIILFLFLNFDFNEWKEIFADIKKTDDIIPVLIAASVVFGLFVLRIVLSWVRWCKTWISVDETSITISVNTINQSVNTIGLKNISNVNIDRNIFEMIIGTSKIKIDTDSRSTAEKTDVKIVLKKDKAEKLRQYLLAGIDRENGVLTESEVSNAAVAGNTDGVVNAAVAGSTDGVGNTAVAGSAGEVGNTAVGTRAVFGGIIGSGEKPAVGNATGNWGYGDDGKQIAENMQGYEVYYNNKNVLTHCMYTAPIMGITITLAGIIMSVVLFVQQLSNGGFSAQTLTMILAEVLSGGVIVVMLFISGVYSLIKDFFKFYKFHARRVKNRIQIDFGMFRRISYEIPVNRINSVVIQKSVISRITHRCCVDLINVGIGDEKEESTRLLLSVPDKHLAEILHRILPEFDEYFLVNPESEYIRQPKKVWWKHIFGVCKILLIAVIAFVAADLFDLFSGGFAAVYLVCVVALICFYLGGCYGGYRANRLQLHKKYLAVSTGMFAMATRFVQYGKIQHMEFRQGPLERILHLQRGLIYILASIHQNMINIPEFESKQIEPLIELFLQDGRK